MRRRRIPQEALDTLPHLSGRLVGEGDCKYTRPRNVVATDNMGDPVSNHPCLAAARTRKLEKRALDVRYRLALLRIQTLKEIHSLPV